MTCLPTNNPSVPALQPSAALPSLRRAEASRWLLETTLPACACQPPWPPEAFRPHHSSLSSAPPSFRASFSMSEARKALAQGPWGQGLSRAETSQV